MIAGSRDSRPGPRSETQGETGRTVIGGINQSLSLLGKTFHTQTELYGDAIRTEIFYGGRVVATREVKLVQADLERGPEALRGHLYEHHKRVTAGLVARASGYHDRGPYRSAASSADGSPDRSQVPVPASDAKPKASAAETAEIGARVRRLFEELWSRLGASDPPTGQDWPRRLEQAASAFVWIRSEPLFTETRIDEQLRVNVLQEQVSAWLSKGQDPGQAEELWAAIETFRSYTAEINNRAELVAWDRELASGLSGEEGAPLAETAESDIPSEEPQTPSGPRPGAPQTPNAGLQQEKQSMAKFNLEPLSSIDGFVGSCLVDSSSGMMLGAVGGGPVNLELAAAGNTEVVRAKLKTMSSLKLNDNIEDILISLGKQYHIIRPVESARALFLYLVLDREKSNLAMARHELKTFESTLNLG